MNTSAEPPHYVRIDIHALVTDGGSPLNRVHADDVLHLPEKLLGLSAGYWRIRNHIYSHPHDPDAPHIALIIHTLDETAAHRLLNDSNATLHGVRVAPNWDAPRPYRLTGMRLGNLRTRMADLADLPDDTPVTIGTGLGYAVAPLGSVAPGLYAPDDTSPNGGLYFDKQDAAAPSRALPTVALWPQGE